MMAPILAPRAVALFPLPIVEDQLPEGRKAWALGIPIGSRAVIIPKRVTPTTLRSRRAAAQAFRIGAQKRLSTLGARVNRINDVEPRAGAMRPVGVGLFP